VNKTLDAFVQEACSEFGPDCRNAAEIVSASTAGVVALLEGRDLTPLGIHNRGFAGFDWRGYIEASRWRALWVLEALRKAGVRGGRVLDQGSFFGNFSLAFQRLGFHVTGCDYYEAMGEVMRPWRELLAAEGVDVRDAGRFAEQLPFLQGAFDVVLSLGVVEHIPHSPRQHLEELIRCLKIGGVLVLETPNLAYQAKREQLNVGQSVYQPLPGQYDSELPFTGHHREYVMAELEWMLERCGLRHLSSDTLDYSYRVLSSLDEATRRQVEYRRQHPETRELLLCLGQKTTEVIPAAPALEEIQRLAPPPRRKTRADVVLLSLEPRGLTPSAATVEPAANGALAVRTAPNRTLYAAETAVASVDAGKCARVALETDVEVVEGGMAVGLLDVEQDRFVVSETAHAPFNGTLSLAVDMLPARFKVIYSNHRESEGTSHFTVHGIRVVGEGETRGAPVAPPPATSEAAEMKVLLEFPLPSFEPQAASLQRLPERLEVATEHNKYLYAVATPAFDCPAPASAALILELDLAVTQGAVAVALLDVAENRFVLNQGVSAGDASPLRLLLWADRLPGRVSLVVSNNQDPAAISRFTLRRARLLEADPEDLSAGLISALPSYDEAADGIARGLKSLARELMSGPGAQAASQTGLALPFTGVERDDWSRAIRIWRDRGRHLLATAAVRACPACGGEDARFVLESFDGFPFHDCLACGTWYVPLDIDQAFFDRFFAECPEAGALGARIVLQRKQGTRPQEDRARIGAYFDELAPFLEGSVGYLDVGCGVGHSLQEAASRGFEAEGLEADVHAVASGRAHGLRISTPDEMPDSARFSLISLWETLEHISRPREVVGSLAGRLAPRGVLALTLPNRLSLEASILRGDCSWINGGAYTPGHINLFTRGSLTRLLESVGLTVLAVDGQYASNVAELVSYVLGTHRGAWDYVVAQNRVSSGLPRAADTFFQRLGPLVATLERLCLLTPIMKLVACRAEDAAALKGAAARYRKARSAAILRDLAGF